MAPQCEVAETCVAVASGPAAPTCVAVATSATEARLPTEIAPAATAPALARLVAEQEPARLAGQHSVAAQGGQPQPAQLELERAPWALELPERGPAFWPRPQEAVKEPAPCRWGQSLSAHQTTQWEALARLGSALAHRRELESQRRSEGSSLGGPLRYPAHAGCCRIVDRQRGSASLRPSRVEFFTC